MGGRVCGTVCQPMRGFCTRGNIVRLDGLLFERVGPVAMTSDKGVEVALLAHL